MGVTETENANGINRRCTAALGMGIEEAYRDFESNRDYVAWLGCWAGRGQLLLSGSNVFK